MGTIDPHEDTRIAQSDLELKGDDVPDETIIGTAAESVPTQVGRYRIIEALGRGGFGTVYLAEDEELQRRVAIKLPHSTLTASDVGASLEEARAVAGLDHNHIVPVYDIGRTALYPIYIVSRYIQGTTLQKELARRRYEFVESARLIASIAEALNYAHQQGLVHRDVKPGNILIGTDGRPFLVDFGLALRKGEFGDPTVLAGTPAYMSPEQIRGEGHRIDGRSDIFSLGVVFYRTLTGERPFKGSNHTEVLQNVSFQEPASLRSLDPSVPGELERICLRAMEKRASDRYFTAQEMANDLQHFLNVQQVTSDLAGHQIPSDHVHTVVSDDNAETQPNISASTQELHIVPRGLRSFDDKDAEFYVNLLPGPRDRDGLPISLRYWKNSVEEANSEATFPVGVLYGPSGCGKSSFIRAGLLPLVQTSTESCYIEASREETESRLLNSLRRRWPNLPKAGLKETLSALRQGSFLPPGRKLLLVIDQFEQWLTNSGRQSDELTDALRQCDGGRVQCILTVRDDFWMSLTRFMQALEVRLTEGVNSASVDLFDHAHAEKVLSAFGRAYGRFSEPDQKKSAAEQQQFVRMAVESLSRDGRVICVHLAVFAEMTKGHPWRPATIREMGGTRGLGVAFLEEAFNGPSVPPERRFHQHATRQVLAALLPQSGGDLKGARRSARELMEACGYENKPDAFSEVISILDSSLRLISATDQNVEDGDAESPSDSSSQQHYQLAHDYLVQSIRDWLNQKQAETRRGRAQLLLAQRAEMWDSVRESKQLPGATEWMRIALLTQARERTESQRQMMKAAGNLHGRNILLASLLLAVVLVSGFLASRRINERHRREVAGERVNALLAANSDDVPEAIADVLQFRTLTVPMLRDVLADSSASERETLLAQLALLPTEPDQQHILAERALTASSEQLQLIANSLQAANSDVANKIWQDVKSGEISSDQKFRAVCLLATLNSESPNWPEVSDFAADWLVQRNSLAEALRWSQHLNPVAESLAPAFAAAFRSANNSPEQKDIALNILTEQHSTQTELLVSLALESSAPQFAVLLPELQSRQTQAVALLQQQIDEPFRPAWPATDLLGDGQPAPDVLQAIADAEGFVGDGFAFCQQMPLNTFRAVVESLKELGYTPIRYRPYNTESSVMVAAVWERDGRDWKIEYGSSAEAVRELNKRHRSDGWLPIDIAHYQEEASDGRAVNLFGAVWSARWDGINDARLYVGVTEQDHVSAWSPLVNDHYSVHTNLKIRASDDQDLYSSIRWKLWHQPKTSDAWNDGIESYEYQLRSGLLQCDVRMTLGYEPNDAPAFAAAWWDGGDFETQELHGLTSGEHMKRCRELAETGFRPRSISVVAPNNQLLAASVWARPFDETGRDNFAIRKARAAIALMHLGGISDVLPLLEHTQDNRLRSLIIDMTALYAVPFSDLLQQLESANSDSVRQALLLAISQYAESRLTSAELEQIIKLASDDYKFHKHPGVHSAAEFVLRKLSADAEISIPESPALKGTDNRSPHWIVTTQGHTLAVIPGPNTFTMGSVPQTVGRDNFRETQHQHRIDRTFAIATKEVTVDQYLRFRDDFDFADNMSRKGNCPINSTGWYDAAKYCRWLSEREGIHPDQMCFPPIEDIGPDMKLPNDYLNRSGYRLPTEAEWEYACRSGSTTERHFGQTELLIDSYAWTARNSRHEGLHRLSEVGSLKPNDFGLFDMLGNVMEWCLDAEDDDSSATTYISNDTRRLLRGGAFLYQPADARAGHRNNMAPPHGGSGHPYIGFRVARTIRAAED